VFRANPVNVYRPSTSVTAVAPPGVSVIVTLGTAPSRRSRTRPETSVRQLAAKSATWLADRFENVVLGGVNVAAVSDGVTV
jgi:hypothetical protein